MISLGIDGGGTNLRFTVNKNGIVYSDRIKKGINITAADENEIEKLVSEMYSLTGNTDFVTGSFSGAGSKERKNIIFKILKKYYKNSDITVLNDAEGLIYSALGNNDGTVVICGTGSIVFGKKGKDTFRSGGWGHLFGDVCSGFWFSERAIQETLKYRDGIINYDILFDEVKKYFKVSEADELSDIQKRKDFKTHIASFSSVFFQTESKITDGIIKEGLEDIIPRCLKMSEITESEKIYYHGGVFSSERFLSEFKKKLGKNIIKAPENIDYYMSLYKI
ncbi:MAG TPA: BadF/BadG/BcrA/BcrD ATPase family protein [Tepiditoga sp.]|nr:BadF/BadG/BcrA/BcrD ATPase family protein [Tepiditoga sp.]